MQTRSKECLPLSAHKSLWRMEDTFQKTRSSLINASRRSKLQADRLRSATPSYTPGQLVLLSTRNLNIKDSRRKLAARFTGPFKIPSFINPWIPSWTPERGIPWMPSWTPERGLRLTPLDTPYPNSTKFDYGVRPIPFLYPHGDARTRPSRGGYCQGWRNAELIVTSSSTIHKAFARMSLCQFII